MYEEFRGEMCMHMYVGCMRSFVRVVCAACDNGMCCVRKMCICMCRWLRSFVREICAACANLCMCMYTCMCMRIVCSRQHVHCVCIIHHFINCLPLLASRGIQQRSHR